MDNRSKGDNGIEACGGRKKLTKEQIEYLLSLLRRAGLNITKEQAVDFIDELTIEVFDKNGNLKEKRVVR